MSSIGIHGHYYNELADKLTHAMEWRLKNLKSETKAKDEYNELYSLCSQIQEKLETGDISLRALEKTAQDFRRIHDLRYTPEKYGRIKQRLTTDHEAEGHA